MEMYGRAFLTSTLDGGVWSASFPGYLTPREIAPVTHWIGGGPQSQSEHSGNIRNFCPCWESNPDSLVVMPMI